MSEQSAFPVQGATRVIIDELARDGQVWGDANADAIEVSYQPAGAGHAPLCTREGDAVRLAQAAVQRVILPANLAVVLKQAARDLRQKGRASIGGFTVTGWGGSGGDSSGGGFSSGVGFSGGGGSSGGGGASGSW
jgi:uncharacterized membrane protein YgcG